MTWRPPQKIQVKAIGLPWRNGKLLAAEVLDDAGRVKGVRPLGGSVEFGETLEEAVLREFKEELGVDITPHGAPTFFENHYIHEAVRGHEIVAMFNVSLPEHAYAEQDIIEFQEAHGAACTARWFSLEDLDLDGGPELYPSGLKAHLLK